MIYCVQTFHHILFKRFKNASTKAMKHVYNSIYVTLKLENTSSNEPTIFEHYYKNLWLTIHQSITFKYKIKQKVLKI